MSANEGATTQPSTVLQLSPPPHIPWSAVKTHPIVQSHVSMVQGMLSSQLLSLVGNEQPPIIASQMLSVHATESSHSELSGTLRQAPVASLQLSTVHEIPSLQFGTVPETQPPLTQVSVPLQN
jgi:hypothetical protein